MNRKYELDYEEGNEALWKIAVVSFRDISQAGMHAIHALGKGNDDKSAKFHSSFFTIGEP